MHITLYSVVVLLHLCGILDSACKSKRALQLVLTPSPTHSLKRVRLQDGRQDFDSLSLNFCFHIDGATVLVCLATVNKKYVDATTVL